MTRMLVVFLALCSAAAAQDLTAQFSASKLEVMNAAYSAARSHFGFENVDVPLGTIWFSISHNRPDAYDCGLVITGTGDSSTATVRFMDRAEQVKEKDRPKLAAMVFRAIRARLGDDAGLKSDSIIDVVSDPHRRIVRGFTARQIYEAAVRPEAVGWRLVREDSAALTATFMAPRQSRSSDVLVLTVIDLGNSEARLLFAYRAASGLESSFGREGQLTASRLFCEDLLSELERTAASR